MGNVLTPAQCEMLRRYLLESFNGVPFIAVRRCLRDQSIPEYELVECAKMLLLNDVNGEDSEGEPIGPNWLNRINLDLKLRDS